MSTGHERERDPEPGPPRSSMPVGPEGLCPACRYVKVLRSDRGSRFLLCQLARHDGRFPRYPPQPRLECPGFER